MMHRESSDVNGTVNCGKELFNVNYISAKV